MIFAIVGDGSLGASIIRALEQAGETVRLGRVAGDAPEVAASEERDLFRQAMGCKAIVYAPSPTLLAATLRPEPNNPEQMREIVSAAHAPGVELIVWVRARGDALDEEETILRRSGKPYVIVRSAPLLEEIADAAGLERTTSVSVPRDRRARVASRAALAAELVRALREDDLQGRSLEVDSEELDLAEVMRQAAASAGHEIEVTAASRASIAVRRVLARMFRRPQRAAHALCEQLATAAAPA